MPVDSSFTHAIANTPVGPIEICRSFLSTDGGKDVTVTTDDFMLDQVERSQQHQTRRRRDHRSRRRARGPRKAGGQVARPRGSRRQPGGVSTGFPAIQALARTGTLHCCPGRRAPDPCFSPGTRRAVPGGVQRHAVLVLPHSCRRGRQAHPIRQCIRAGRDARNTSRRPCRTALDG